MHEKTSKLFSVIANFLCPITLDVYFIRQNNEEKKLICDYFRDDLVSQDIPNNLEGIKLGETMPSYLIPKLIKSR